MKEMTIKRATIIDALLEAFHELILLPNPATEPKVVSGEGVDQHLATIHYVESQPKPVADPPPCKLA